MGSEEGRDASALFTTGRAPAEWTDIVARPSEPLDRVRHGIPRWAKGIESMPIPGSMTIPRGLMPSRSDALRAAADISAEKGLPKP